MSNLTDAITRLRGRCKIALASDSQYDEFVIVEDENDARWLMAICDSRAELLEALFAIMNNEHACVAMTTPQHSAATNALTKAGV